MKQMILLTGGAGFIGSHIAVELLQAGYGAVIVDNLKNSKAEVIDKIEQISGSRPVFYEGDVADKSILEKIFDEQKIESVVHLAGLKAVAESVAQPLMYYRNNIDSTLSLLEVMAERNLKNLIFSSSATVYGRPEVLPPATAGGHPVVLPYREDGPTGVHINNPYGRTKYMIEEILRDLTLSDEAWHAISLRYFNPIGAHESGLIGENPNDIPNNIIPVIAQVATGKREVLNIYGDDYDTPDGTCQRDYIHVVDIAKGHVAALQHIDQTPGFTAYNLGTGSLVSVKQLVETFETSMGLKIPHVYVARRPGDLPAYYADPTKANSELGWQAEKTIHEACADVWRYLQAEQTIA